MTKSTQGKAQPGVIDPKERPVATKEQLRTAAGRMIIAGFEGSTLSPELKEILREVRPLGLILFTRNFESAEHLRELARELKDHRKDEPLLLSIDQEGGRVARVKQPATVWPPMRALGDIGDEELVERVGAALAKELRALCFDVDFAPVLDVDTNPKNPIIGDRSFSRDPQVVGRLGAALVRGLQQNGVAACGKHFPGHGDTEVDSHLALPKVEHELRRLQEIEWPPFAQAIRAGVGAIMTAHVVVPALDENRPGTLSQRVLSRLRDELKFKGVIVSDDVEMKAVFDHYSLDQMALEGTRAGVDLFLACRKPEVVLQLFRSLVQAAERGDLKHRELLDAEKRTLAWRQRYYQAPGKPADFARWVGCGEHAALVEEIHERARDPERPALA